MGFWDWARNIFRPKEERPTSASVIEQAFSVVPVASRTMEESIRLWWSMYTNRPPWETDCVKSIGVPGAVARELARNSLSEFDVTVSGSPRADYIDSVVRGRLVYLKNDLEIGLALGGIAFRPYIDEAGRLLIDSTAATSFTPIKFDGEGRATAGVFRQEVKYSKEIYTRLEYHGFEALDNGETVYVIRNRAYKGPGGGAEIELASVPEWANLESETIIKNIEKPLFSYFRVPIANSVEPGSMIGVSVYGDDATVRMIQQADEQWERIIYEYKSGQRKIFAESDILPGQVEDRLFVKGNFTSDGDLFQEFSPELRDDPMYMGFQRILQRIEYNTGLSFGTLSDPSSVEKTATEILAAKNRQRTTAADIQAALQRSLDDLLYAVNAFCDLYSLAPPGEYEATYNWGDGVMDDPETLRQERAMDLQEVSAGLLNPYEYRMKWRKEDEEKAKAMLPSMEDMTTEEQQEIE